MENFQWNLIFCVNGCLDENILNEKYQKSRHEITNKKIHQIKIH